MPEEPGWGHLAETILKIGEMFSRAWQCAPRFDGPPPTHDEDFAVSAWCIRLCEVPQAVLEVPEPLRPLILARYAAAASAAKSFASFHPFPEGATEMGALRTLLTDYWRDHVVPNWHKLGEYFFSE